MAPSRRSFVVATALLLASGTFLSTADAAAAPTDLPKYIQKTLSTHQNTSGLKASFVEKKHITFLKAPLLSEGEIFYCHPGLFARTTQQPEVSKLVVKDDKIMFRQGGEKPQTISLKERPELRSLVSGVLLLFQGDMKKILELYQTTPHGNADAWSLELTPKDSSLKTLVKKLIVRGQADKLRAFEVHEASGDYSVTELKRLSLDEQFSAETKQRIFSV